MEHATRYEALRTFAIHRDAPVIRDGLVVLLRRGLAAWMAAWSRLPAAPARPTRDEHRQSTPLSDNTSAEVVHVLAAMTLGHLEEVQP